ncbi:MAG: helix-turn-helix domain-containing protein [Ideonella sp.]|nr:helix-turn-helix domain-containing protein [Ideonella sp.]
MELHAPAVRVATVEAELARTAGASRIALLVELAWHLRQRDSARALRVVEEAEAALGAASPTRPARAAQLRIALTRCEIAALFCRHEEAEHWLARALADAAADADGPTDACLAERLVAKARGQGARTVEATLRAVQASDSGTDPARVQIARAWLAYERAYGAPAPAREADLAVARRSHVAVDALMSAVDAVRVLRREPVRAVGLFLHASEQAQRVGLVRDAVVATINAGTTLRGLGEHEKAAACFDISESVARQTGWPGLLGTSRTQLGAFLRAQDRLEEAHQLLVEAHLALVPTPPGVNRANACSELALVRLRLERAVEAVEPMAEAIRMLRDAGAADNLALSLIDQSTILAAANQLPEALAAIAEASALIDSHGLAALAVNLHQALAEIHRRHALPAPPGMGEPTAALHHAERALSEGRRYPGWQPSASELTALADDWSSAGDPARAFAHARAAIAAMKQEMALLTRPSPSLAPLRSAGAAPPVDEGGLWHPAFPPSPSNATAQFTPKEMQVLRLLARSYTNKEIAISLEVSDQTVKWHLKQVFGKLEVGSRRQAVSRARALGVLAFDS